MKKVLKVFKWLFILGLAICVVTGVVMCTGDLVTDPVPMPSVVGMTYKDAKQALSDGGVVVYSEKDTKGEAVTPKDDYVVAAQTPDAGTEVKRYFSGVTIVVKSPAEIAAEQAKADKAQADELKSFLEGNVDQTVSTFYGQLASYGYTVTWYHATAGNDISDMVVEDATDPEREDAVAWVLTKVGDVDYANKTVSLTVQSPELLENERKIEELKENFPLEQVWATVKYTGEKLYPYGFKLHYILGVISTEYVDSTTWHVKVYCDVTNSYGATAKNMTCDATVTLTGSSSSKCTSFNIY